MVVDMLLLDEKVALKPLPQYACGCLFLISEIPKARCGRLFLISEVLKAWPPLRSYLINKETAKEGNDVDDDVHRDGDKPTSRDGVSSSDNDVAFAVRQYDER
ncbi:hypothetical protein F2Q70_00001716 [Brassica cretica]|uniref:Uncharacterized protein n=1 Tax=Brassica cretica TaxID=69181 RepID=A0A8S9IQK7_BRACR|nr:hypothetical protein F2Q70_00001716 [Brassica cretica]